MAAFADILIRADAILEKYSHYDEVGQYNHRRGRSQKSEDPFSEKYFEIMDRIQELNLVGYMNWIIFMPLYFEFMVQLVHSFQSSGSLFPFSKRIFCRL